MHRRAAVHGYNHLLTATRLNSAQSSSLCRRLVLQTPLRCRSFASTVTTTKPVASKPPAGAKKKATGPGATVRKNAQDNVPTSRTETLQASSAKSTSAQSAGPREKSADEQLAEIEQLMNIAHFYPTADPWGQRIETLDVQIPYSVKLNINNIRSGLWWSNVKDRMGNGAKSAMSMYRMALVDAFPRLMIARGFVAKLFFWPVNIFRWGNNHPDMWLAPFRSDALETYKLLHSAVAKGDVKTVKALSTDAYLSSSLSLIRNRNKNHNYDWKIHPSESSPTVSAKHQKDLPPSLVVPGPEVRVVSVRATDGYLGKEEPKMGNRLLVHALVRFDTVQSLKITNNKGQTLLPSGEVAPPHHNTGLNKRTVVEYLVFEKRMWYPGPWVVREQLHPKKHDKLLAL